MAAEESTAAGPTGRAGGGAKGDANRIELDKRGQTLARRVAESKAIIPHLYLRRQVELSEADEAHLAVRVAAALADHPRLNAAYRDGAIDEYPRVNIGLAVGAAAGSQYPVLTDAGESSEEELAEQIEELRKRVASDALTSPEVAGATFTLTCVAGADELTPVITAGQAAHLAIGRRREAAIVEAGSAAVGWVSTLTLAVDHRAVQTAEASAFLARLADLLEGRG